jgi:hypothetical protein
MLKIINSQKKEHFSKTGNNSFSRENARKGEKQIDLQPIKEEISYYI